MKVKDFENIINQHLNKKPQDQMNWAAYLPNNQNDRILEELKSLQQNIKFDKIDAGVNNLRNDITGLSFKQDLIQHELRSQSELQQYRTSSLETKTDLLLNSLLSVRWC